MTYAQKDYPQILGKGTATIAQAGSLLTAMTNVAERFVESISPDAADARLAAAGVDSSAGLAYSFISLIEPSLGIVSFGQNAPSSDSSIVKMTYISKLTGGPTDTYAAVVSAQEGTIIDSFDGLTKSWDVYGGPKEYVTFAKFPLTTTPPIGIPEPKEEVSPDTYKIVTYLNGFTTPEKTNGISGIVEPGDYYITDSRDDSMILVSKAINGVGFWVDTTLNTNNIDLEDDTPIDTQGGIYTPSEDQVKVTINPPITDKFKDTYVAGLGNVETVCIKDAVVRDASGDLPDKQLTRGTLAVIAGKFIKDGQTYFRTVKSVETGAWYGIEREALRRVSDLKDEEQELDDLLDSINMDVKDEPKKRSFHDRLIKSAATAEGKLSRLMKRKNK